MYNYIKSLVLLVENSTAFEFGSMSFFLVWSVCTIFFIFLCVTEYVVKNFIRKDFIDENILNRLFSAIESCNTKEAIELLDKYPNYVNAQLGDLDYTPFLVACYSGNTLLVKFMLHIGADVKSRTKRGESPFYLSVAQLINNPFSKDASCMRELFYAGCDVNGLNMKGYSALHLAAFFGHKTLVRWLLKKGANTRVTPSPVEIAAKHGHLEVASLISIWENRRRMITSN